MEDEARKQPSELNVCAVWVEDVWTLVRGSRTVVSVCAESVLIRGGVDGEVGKNEGRILKSTVKSRSMVSSIVRVEHVGLQSDRAGVDKRMLKQTRQVDRVAPSQKCWLKVTLTTLVSL